jgi:hypothetical protein
MQLPESEAASIGALRKKRDQKFGHWGIRSKAKAIPV